MLQRRLLDTTERIRRLRAEVAVDEEQLAFLEEEADDARLRALVSETPVADHARREARRHADALARHLDHLRHTVKELERERDDLLDRMSRELAEPQP